MNGAVVVYLVYVLLAVALISWLGMTLQRYGRVFLDDVFSTQSDLAGAISRLLVTGFIVFTLGYALLLLRIDAGASTTQAVRSSTRQFGLLLLSLGIMHSVNMLILLRARRRFGGQTDDGRRRPARR